MSYEFNGLLDSVLPNVYINKITLEQLNSQPPSHNKYDVTPHIDQSKTPEREVQVTATTTEIVTEPNLTAGYGSYEDKLRVIFDLFLEIPNVDSDDFWSFLFDDDITKHLSLKLLVLAGAGGKEQYLRLLNPANTWAQVTDVVDLLENGNPVDWDLVEHDDYHYENKTSLFAELIDPGKFIGSKTADTGDISDSQRLAYVKQKYAKTLPDGTVVYKIPIRMEARLNGAFPTDLAAIAYCGLDVSEIFQGMASAGASGAQINLAKTNAFGRMAMEVIIQNKRIQQSGMIFFVSNDQSVATDQDLSAKREAAFNHLKGQLWFGNVQLKKLPKKDRYMAGSNQKGYESTEAMKPFLDYVTVPNRRIQDFRQVATIQKQIANFNPVTNLVFGGDYIDLRAKATGTSFENLAVFSNLLSSVDKFEHIKLFFSIDWGKLIKKYCAIPALLDKLSQPGAPGINQLLGDSPSPLSFKVYRKRVDAGSEVGDNTNEQLIYNGYPNLYYFGAYHPDVGAAGKPTISSLAPVKLDSAATSFNGYHRHYSFTDYGVNRGKGNFKYSIEIEIYDPTLDYFKDQLKLAKLAISKLKKYMYLANGTHGNQLYYNSYLGEFEEEFKILATSGTDKIEGLGFGDTLPSPISDALGTLQFMTGILRSNYTAANAAIETVDTKPSIGGLTPAITNMLNPYTATPDSITAVYEIFTTLTAQLRNFIKSFSTVKKPKIDSALGASGNKIEENFTTTPVGAATPERKIMIRHDFDDLAELVDTTQMAAGYDFFADLKNTSKYGVGLKLIPYDSYSEKSISETLKYFAIEGSSPHLRIPLQLSSLADDKGKILSGKSVFADTEFTQGQFFTLGTNSPGSPSNPFGTQFTKLPKSIKSANEENEPWKLINNVIRYKLNLLGNPGKYSYLGYDDNDNIPGSEFIGPTMERILKEYQTLAHKGAVFVHEQYAKPGDPAMSKGIIGPLDYVASDSEPVQDEQAPPPESESSDNPLPPYYSSQLWFLPEPATKVPWAANVGQERFLLALIMQSCFNLKFNDIKLGSFNANIIKSITSKYLSSFVPSKDKGFKISIKKTWEPWVKAALDNLPNQILVLVANHNKNIKSNINPKMYYLGNDKLYNSAEEGTDQETMFAQDFGTFWFQHQNLVEVQYLSGYKKVTQGGNLNKYENSMGSSVINSPVWKPLKAKTAQNFNKDADGLLLCRLKKYRHPLFTNKRAYDILDLPLYDEHFLMLVGSQLNARDALQPYPPSLMIKTQEPSI
jgi:hypothetical protein